MGYGSPHTLGSTSPGTEPGCKGDLTALRPTFFIAVPALMEKIRTGLMAKIARSSALKRALFNLAVRANRGGRPHGFRGRLLKKVVLRKIAKKAGLDRLMVMCSGGAPLARATQEFVCDVFSPTHVVQIYGATETGPISACVGGWDMAKHVAPEGVGGTMFTINYKLVDWPDARKDPAVPTTREDPPRGEIWCKGPGNAQGYFKNPGETDAAFVRDAQGRGWYRTGDIGLVVPDASFGPQLRIVDRVKHTVKLAAGEFVALNKVEAVLTGSRFVERVCVFARPDKSYVVALVSAPMGGWIEGGKLKGVPGDAEVLADIKAVCAGKLARFEVPRQVRVLEEEWQPEDGLITPTMKNRRKQIQEHYADLLKEMDYDMSGGIK